MESISILYRRPRDLPDLAEIECDVDTKVSTNRVKINGTFAESYDFRKRCGQIAAIIQALEQVNCELTLEVRIINGRSSISGNVAYWDRASYDVIMTAKNEIVALTELTASKYPQGILRIDAAIIRTVVNAVKAS